jgi:Ran GTPase-activating protein (RanGAP) involved in mRNA processing and transport
LGALCNSSYLTSLKLTNMALSYAVVSSIAAALEGNRHLTYLQLSDCDMDRDGWRVIASTLPENMTLKHLDLSQCGTLDDDGCFVIGSFVEGNTALKTLQLQNDESPQVTSQGITSFMRILEKNTMLEFLELSFTANDDSGFKSVADALVRNLSLKRLYLENQATAVSTMGAVAIGKSLETGNAGLENIALVFDGADSDGVLALAKAVEKSSTLKHFTFNCAEYRSYRPDST